MILGRIVIGIIIFALALGSYLAFPSLFEKPGCDALAVWIILGMCVLFVCMALYILIQRGWI